MAATISVNAKLAAVLEGVAVGLTPEPAPPALAPAPPVRDAANPLVFKTTTFSLVLDGTGKVSSFTAADGTEHAASPPTAFMALVPEAAAEGGWVDVAAVRMVNESVLEASFTWTAANVAVADVAVQQQQGSAATAPYLNN